MGAIAAENLKKTSGHGAYADGANKAITTMKKLYDGKNLTDQEVLAKEIAKAATVAKPKIRYVKGFMAKPMIFIRKWFGDRIFDKLVLNFS